MSQEQRTFFEYFYREHFSYLVAYAYRFLTNWDNAKVVTQEAFLVGLEKSDKFFACESQIAWMKSVIRKKAANMNRTRRQREAVVVPIETLSTPPSTYDSYENAEVDALLAHCAAILKPKEYDLFIKVIWRGRPYPQVAQEIGISEWACRKRIQCILQKLSREWNKGI